MMPPQKPYRALRAPSGVRAMFDRIAPRYDLLNHLLSFGIDIAWRRRSVRVLAPGAGERVLDLCCGTADLCLALAGSGAQVIGADFSRRMLALGRRKARRRRSTVSLCGADALALPFSPASFDAASVAFGVRNLADPLAGLREVHRVLRPGGRLLVLEFTPPRRPLIQHAHRLYLRTALPALGLLIAGDADAYRYLAKSISAFYEPGAFVRLLGEAGFEPSTPIELSGGIAAIYHARAVGEPAASASRSPVA
ncbi:MAG: bifunctional demethylmenaquinone methyltransferase/2-methoxy-6-polyprenyl-1,4-benzoquinol methylase UbiE [Acidobacteriota bacterium]